MSDEIEPMDNNSVEMEAVLLHQYVSPGHAFIYFTSLEECDEAFALRLDDSPPTFVVGVVCKTCGERWAKPGTNWGSAPAGYELGDGGPAGRRA